MVWMAMNRVVLIVDDEPELRNLLTLQLQREGFNVLSAESGEKALELLTTSTHVDVILSDIKMPGGMDGIELIKKLQEKNIKLPVNLLMSGHYVPNENDLKYLNIDKCLNKPFSVKELSKYLNDRITQVKNEAARKHPRLSCHIPIEAPEGEEIGKETNNVSLGGIFIEREDPFPVGTKFGAQLSIDPPLTIELEVKWIRKEADSRPAGMGCEFINIDAKDIERLQSYLEEETKGPDSILDFSSEDH